MKTRYIAACALAITTMGAWPFAYSAPIGFNGTQVVRFLTTNDSVDGSNSCQANICVNFSAQALDDLNGVPTGGVSATLFDLSNFQFQLISCFGPAYAKSVSVIEGNGNATVSATLDPSAADCFSINVIAPVTLDLAGRANGTFHNSSDGSFTTEFSGQVIKGRSQVEQFSDTFIGTVGSFSGTFQGSANASRNSQLQRVK